MLRDVSEAKQSEEIGYTERFALFVVSITIGIDDGRGWMMERMAFWCVHADQ